MSIRVKSLLTPFFKIAHPDVLRSAPENIQKSNSSALATLNAYIDSVTSGQQVSLASLRFFVPHKSSSNGKVSSYKECKVPLLPLKENSSENIRAFHLESLVNSINLSITNPESTEPEPLSQDPQQRPRMKHELWNHFTSSLRKYHIFEATMEDLRKIDMRVAEKLERGLNMSNPLDFKIGKIHPGLIGKSAVKASVKTTFFKSIEKVFTRLDRLFIDKDLPEEEVNIGLYYLSGKNLTVEEKQELKSTYDLIHEEGISYVISSRYSAHNVPGAIQVPFKFDAKELNDFYKENTQVFKERLQDAVLFKEKTERMLRFITDTIAPCTLGRYMYQNNDIYERQTFSQSFIAAKKIKELVENRKIERGLVNCNIVIGNEFKVEPGKVEVPMSFGENEIVSFFRKVSKTHITVA